MNFQPNFNQSQQSSIASALFAVSTHLLPSLVVFKEYLLYLYGTSEAPR